MCLMALFFFFSSRRRHTRCYRDWSSDVCSSDLWATEETARKIAQLGGKDLDQLRQSAASRAFRPAPLGVRLDMTLRAQSQRMTSPNVVAIYRGIDPTLKNEYVVYS